MTDFKLCLMDTIVPKGEMNLMYALVSPEKIKLPAGTAIRLPATLQEYQALCDQRGDGCIPRIKYRNGEVLSMSSLPLNGRDAH